MSIFKIENIEYFRVKNVCHFYSYQPEESKRKPEPCQPLFASKPIIC